MNVEIHACSANEFRLTCRKPEEVSQILKIMAQENHITWRILKTDPHNRSAGNKQIFYAEYFCQGSNLRIAPETLKPHRKHVDCKAQMKISIKRISDRNR